MAKRGEDETDEAGHEQVTEREIQKQIPPKRFKDLLKTLDRSQDEIDEIKGAMGGAVAAVTEKYHLDKKMLSWIRQLAKMSPETLADKLAHFEYLLDISGLSDRAKSAQRLGLGDDEGGATVHTLRAAE
jgi:hypothetical protein